MDCCPNEWLYPLVGIDRTSKFADALRVATADRKTAWAFLQPMLETVPCQVHAVLTDNGIQFAEQPRNRNTIYSRPMHFDMICEANGIEHWLTKPNPPWSHEDAKKSGGLFARKAVRSREWTRRSRTRP